MNIHGIAVAGSLLALSLFSIGCGSNNSSSTAFTQSQALTATADLFAAMAEAPLTTGHVRTPIEVNAVANGIRNANLNGAACMPCGACRQTILEFSIPETAVFYPNADGETVSATLAALLPDAFRLTTE